MSIRLRPAQESDFDFAFDTKQKALGPYVAARWGWNHARQLAIHRTRWTERPWLIILDDTQPIGTVSIGDAEDHVRFGEFYLLPEHQRKGIGSIILRSTLQNADAHGLPVKLEYLKWNPVGSLYQRHGFIVTSESDTHYFLVRPPSLHSPGLTE
ncbi:GNAT family N-acetyltransferase [Rhodoferax sp.]|uniref:GNAT family N-acetyltransferase n=1 Tax=Rhodoferax sp. TaxID=50421 RepID=UPI002761CC69|nr:GNAT family N-acetyltransferase [Rhodoferax sp.]